MKLWSKSMRNGALLDSRFSFCRRSAAGTIQFSQNINPHLAWSDAPAQTRAYALICYDDCAPTIRQNVNRPPATLPPELPRTDFFHWVLVIPAERQAGQLGLVFEVEEGAFSLSVTPKGKPPKDHFTGLNDFTHWFQGDTSMEGSYFGYDGPAPPFNDEVVHTYHFVVYALSVPAARLGLPEVFTGWDVRAAMEGHVIEQARITVKYSLS